MKSPSYNQRVLAIDPYDRGLGFAVLEGPNELVDWGLKDAQSRKGARFLELLEKLIARYEPDVLITEDSAREGSNRHSHTRLVLRRIQQYARRRSLRVRTYSRSTVEKAFVTVGATNKHEIATIIAGWFPELMFRLPRPQKPWTGENRSMNIFDALSFALTYFHVENIQLLTARSPQPSFSALGGNAARVPPGHDQSEEDAKRLSSPIRAFPWLRPEKISPYTCSRRDREQGVTAVEDKVWRY